MEIIKGRLRSAVDDELIAGNDYAQMFQQIDELGTVPRMLETNDHTERHTVIATFSKELKPRQGERERSINVHFNRKIYYLLCFNINQNILKNFHSQPFYTHSQITHSSQQFH